jgi:hypothetical protein
MEALDQQLIFAGAALLCASTSSVLDIQECKVADCVTAPAIAGGLIRHGMAEGWHGLRIPCAVAMATGCLFACCNLDWGAQW